MSTSNDPFASVFAGSTSYEVDPVRASSQVPPPSPEAPVMPPQSQPPPPTSSHMQPTSHDVEALRSISREVEQFTRQWFTRIRRVINRSAQLLERESLLAGAIAKLDQQKSEWSRRTAERELALRDQAKQLTAAWMEVESQRRKSLQGGRVSGPIGTVPMTATGPVVRTAAPVSVTPPSSTGAPSFSASTEPASSSVSGEAGLSSVSPANPSSDQRCPAVDHTTHPSHQPAPVSPTSGAPNQSEVPPVANRPILPPGNHTSSEQELSEEERHEADAQSRQRIEEFKRMQRALRFNRQR